MGQHPVIDPTTHYGNSRQLRYCHTTIQGWRPSNEDAHVACLDIGNGNSFFGVFDGHGGPEVAIYVSQHIVQTLIQNPYYKAGIYEKALKQTFFHLDAQMRTKTVQA